MPRPRKFRRVCCMPKCVRFGPLGELSGGSVCMTVEEYETILLIDLTGDSQEQCAARMGIARTTVQGIYNTARRKLAEALVHGRVLSIEGGDYQLCGEAMSSCSCRMSAAACPRWQEKQAARGCKEKGEIQK